MIDSYAPAERALDDPALLLSAGDTDALLAPLLDLRHLLGSEWNPDILVKLYRRPHRYTELLEAVRASSVIDRWSGRTRFAQARTFIATLRRMEADGLLFRHEEIGVWPREVHYELTPAARRMLATLLTAIE